MSLYEGTTGIQSLDLLGRKVIMQEGKALKVLMHTIHQTIREAAEHPSLSVIALQLENEIHRMQRVLEFLQPKLLAGKLDEFLSDATVFMEMTSYLVIGWQWLKMGIVAKKQLADHPQLPTVTKQSLENTLHTLQFYFRYELSHTQAFEASICNGPLLTQQPLEAWEN
jgi:butyryl-CoA dehydrogenase